MDKLIDFSDKINEMICEIEIRMISPDEESLQSYPFFYLAKDPIKDELARRYGQQFKNLEASNRR